MAYKASTGIYEIVNTINGKRYVGSSVDLRRRKNVHWRSLHAGKHHNAILQAAWVKHGEAAFEFRVLRECERANLVIEEQAAIDRLEPEYNLSPTAGNILGFRFTDDQRAARRGRKQTEEWKRKRAEAHVGKKRSEETRKRISDAMTGKSRGQRSAEHRAALGAAFKGKPKAPEHMAALQAGRVKRVYSEEQRAAISAKLREQYASGARSRDRSPEYREKIAATLRGKRKLEAS